MPQAIGALLLPGLLGSATVLGTGISLASVVGSAVLFGVTTGIQAFLAPKPQSPTRGADAQTVINQAIAPRVRVYGRAKVGGVRALFHTKDGAQGQKNLYQAVMLASHEIDAIEEYYIGDVRAYPESDGRVLQAPFGLGASSYAYVWGHLGYSDQQADGNLTSQIGEVWTAAHRLRGIAYISARFQATVNAEDFANTWPGGANTALRAVIRGAKVYDPRNNSTAWSENAALCILDYLIHQDGMKLPYARIDGASFASFANLCDEWVNIAAGGGEKRYRLWGTVVLTEEPADVLQRMLATCDGELYETNEGKVAIRGGRWEAPDVTIEDKHILQIGEISEGKDALAAFNEVKPIYTSPNHDYQPTEAQSYANEAAKAKYGAAVEDLALDMVPSPYQARRLAKIFLAKGNPALQGSIVTNLAGLNALGEPTIQCVIPEIEVNDSFRVTSFKLQSDLTGCEIGISSIGADAYAWNAGTEDGVPPA